MEKRNLLVVGCILIMSTLMMTYYLSKHKNDQEQVSVEVYQSDVSLSTVELEQKEVVVVPKAEESKESSETMDAKKKKKKVEKSESESVQEVKVKAEKEDNTAKEVEEEMVVRKGKTKTKALNVRNKPVKDAKVILIIEKDTQFDILSETFDGWYEIDVDGIIGYAYSEYITLIHDRVES